MEAIVEELKRSLGVADFVQMLVGWLPNVIAASATLVGFYLLWRLAWASTRLVIQRAALDQTAASFVRTVLKNVLLAIAVVTALGRLGVNTGSLLASLGVAGLTIGFAAKDALSNMISGIFIFWDRPFVIGDLVEIGGHYGRVDAITMRSTRVVTPDGRMLAVPNSAIVNSTVASYTNFPNLRLDIAITVSVNEDLGRARRLALDVADTHPGLMQDPKPVVVVTALNDYNVALELQAWLADEKQHVLARHQLRERLFESFRSAGVDMPFETLVLAPNGLQEVAGAA